MIDLFVSADLSESKIRSRPKLKNAFAGALAGHVVLLAVLLLAMPSGTDGRPSEQETIRKALAEIAAESGPATSETPGADSEEAAREIGRSLRFADEEDLRKKVEIVKAMLHSFFKASRDRKGSYLDLSGLTLDEIQEKIESGEIRLPDGDKVFASESGGPQHELEIHTLAREDEDQIARLAQPREDGSGSGVSRTVPPGVTYISPEIYYRKSPYEWILAYGPSLFTVVRGFREFAPPAEKAEERSGDSRPASRMQAGDPVLLTLLLLSGDSVEVAGGAVDGGPAAAFRPERLDEILETWMDKPEIEQFAEFKRGYLDRYSADSSDLARFTERFISSNLNGVFFAADRFSEAFDTLEELFYKRPIYDAFLDYAERHPDTETAAVFLFALAAAYDFERRTLRFLGEVEPEANEILTEGVPNFRVFDYRVKAYVLKKMAGDMRASLLKSGWMNMIEAQGAYRNASLAIYRYLAEKGGELRDRALYAVGATYWEEGDAEKAFAAWRRISPSYDTPEFQFIRPNLNTVGFGLSEVGEKINRYLKSRAGLGNEILLRRQLRFHKWTNRVKTWDVE